MSTLFVSGSVNISGTYKINGEEPYQRKVNITTSEQATGEKFLGRDVYVKGWEGPFPSSSIITDFFPNPACCVFDYGGDSARDYETDRAPFPYVGEQGIFRRNRDLGLRFANNTKSNIRLWVKYTKE
jgi:hypothetical protein